MPPLNDQTLAQAKGFQMGLINFHSEHPASQDVFPGSSHDKVAAAIYEHLLSPKPSRVVGLDGEFGSGKSSILKMLQGRLTTTNSAYKVWFFDCEQNYQGSTKSNFIELFTDEVLQELSSSSSEAATVKASRDRALGRLFEYTKRTTSRVSGWALAVFASLFFAATSFREIFALSRTAFVAEPGSSQEAASIANTTTDVYPWLILIHCISLLSPLLILLLAKIWHRNVKVGGQNWSLLSLFKGSTEDHVNEKIEVSKEVTPLDLKRTLLEQLDIVKNKNFVIILDNLDRLPKDNLRLVWSDLEIFIAVAAEADNLTVIVPFCSTKVAEYLKADADRRYDSRDFIAKKFPVVFRAPPVITSGWKDGFRQLWNQTFGVVDVATVENCAQLLQRHSPMIGKAVTPRLQKKFINDIAATSLVVGEDISFLTIAAYLLLCKYTEISLTEILRADGFSEDYEKELKSAKIADLVNETKSLLSTLIGDTMETGWQIQFLQIHYITTSDIAIAELLDTPLQEAFENEDHDKLISLTKLFGFKDAFIRMLALRPKLSDLLPTIAEAHKIEGTDIVASLLLHINDARLDLFDDSTAELEQFYRAFHYCKELGLEGGLLNAHGSELRRKLVSHLNKTSSQEELQPVWLLLWEYDLYLYAQSEEPRPITLTQPEHIMRLLPDIAGLNIISSSVFKLNNANLAEAHKQLASCPEYLLSSTPLPDKCVEPAFIWLYAQRELGHELVGGIEPNDVAALANLTSVTGSECSAILGLGLAKTVDQALQDNVTSLLASNETCLAKAVAATIYIRAGNSQALATIEDLDDVFASPVFQALATATVTTSMLFNLLTDDDVGNSVAGVTAKLINENRIGKLSCNWVVPNFGTLTQALSQHGLSASDVAEWLNPWDSHIQKLCQDVLNTDTDFIERLLQPEMRALPKSREALVKLITKHEISQDDWVEIFSTGAEQYLAIIKAVVRDGTNIPTIHTARDALAALFNSINDDSPGSNWSQSQFSIIDTILNALDTQQKNIIGIRLRALLFSESVEPKALAEILARYGSLIPDIQPSSPYEVLRVVLFLDYLSRNPESSAELAKFFDSRADQIANYKYSTELRVTMGGAVAKLATITPDLYKKFTMAKGFVKLMRSFRLSARDERLGEGEGE